MLIGLLLISMIAGISTTFLVGLWLPLGIVGSVFAFGASGATIVLFASLIYILEQRHSYVRPKPFHIVADFDPALMWSAPNEWSKLIVNAWLASGLSGRWFPAPEGGSPERYVA